MIDEATGTFTERLSNFALGHFSIPQAVSRHAKRVLLDALGLAIAGTTAKEAQALSETMRSVGGSAEATAIGCDVKLPAGSAVLVNASLIHASDFDDTHIESVCHVGPCIAPVALAMAERTGANGAKMLAAFILGGEVMIRVGLVGGSGLARAGYHPTGYCGAFGATAAAAILLGLTRDELTNAFGIVATFASGSSAYLPNGASTKRLHPAWAGHSGIMAALFAKAGLTGPRTAIEGPFGLLPVRLRASEYNNAMLKSPVDPDFRFPQIAFKKYPVSHIIAAYIDAIFELKARHGINERNVLRVVCHVHPDAARTVFKPEAERRRPSSSFSAKFSLPFAIALALHRQLIGQHDFDDASRDEDILCTSDKVFCAEDSTLDFPRHLPARVDVATTDGNTHSIAIEYPEGTPENPMTDGQIGDKFLLNTKPVLKSATAETLMSRLLDIEQIEDISADIMRLTRPEIALPRAANGEAVR